MVFEKYRSAIEKKIGYVFRDPSLLCQAFTRESFCNEANCREKIPYQSGEVLEFFGDSVLSTSIITFLMRDNVTRYEHGIRTEITEGGFTNIKSRLSDKTNLSQSMKKLGLQEYLVLGEGDKKLGVAESPSVMEDLFEAIVGAIYIDSGYSVEAVMRSLEKMLDVSLYLSAAESGERVLQSAKNALQEYCDDKHRRLPHPEYRLVSESGPDHKKSFRYACVIGEETVAEADGKNRKIAESRAAEAALKILIEREDKER